MTDVVGMPDRDFPKVPDHREASYATVESAVLREMILEDRSDDPRAAWGWWTARIASVLLV